MQLRAASEPRADLGVPPIVARDLDIPGKLKAAGYQQVAGDRFERPVPDVPARIIRQRVTRLPRRRRRPRARVHEPATAERAGRDRPRDNRGPRSPYRPPVELALDLRRLNGDVLAVWLLFPDEVSALTLKPSQPASG